MPQRIQLRRTRGWRKPEGAVVVSRPSKWGNPFRVGRVSDNCWAVDDVSRRLPLSRHFTDQAAARARSVELFALHVGPMGLYEYDSDTLTRLREELGGRDLACWCPLPAEGEPDHCHAAVLLELANGGEV